MKRPPFARGYFVSVLPAPRTRSISALKPFVASSQVSKEEKVLSGLVDIQWCPQRIPTESCLLFALNTSV